jgi:hypothetical protein
MSTQDFYIDERDMTLEEVADALKKYERKYGMTSKEFYEKWKRGETYLVSESVEWVSLFESYQALNGYDSHDGRVK